MTCQSILNLSVSPKPVSPTLNLSSHYEINIILLRVVHSSYRCWSLRNVWVPPRLCMYATIFFNLFKYIKFVKTFLKHIHMERIRYSSIRDFHRKYFQNFYYRQLHELCQSCYYNWIEIDDLVIDLILGSTFSKSISQTFPKKTLHKPFPPKTYSLCQNSSQCLFLL